MLGMLFNHIARSRSGPIQCRKAALQPRSLGGVYDRLRCSQQASAISTEILLAHRTDTLTHHNAGSFSYMGQSPKSTVEPDGARHHLRSRGQIHILHAKMRFWRSEWLVCPPGLPGWVSQSVVPHHTMPLIFLEWEVDNLLWKHKQEVKTKECVWYLLSLNLLWFHPFTLASS